MFDHVTIRASDLVASGQFYRTVLSPLGIRPDHQSPEIVEWDDFSITPATAERPPTRHLHVAFVSPSRANVDAFWQAGVNAGYTEDGPPGPRPDYKPGLLRGVSA